MVSLFGLQGWLDVFAHCFVVYVYVLIFSMSILNVRVH